MTKILGLSGSLRTQSYNTALLRAAKQQADANVTFELATLHGIPLYDGDVEQQTGLPQAVVDLKTRIANCDGLLLATPEYNNGIPVAQHVRHVGKRIDLVEFATLDQAVVNRGCLAAAL